VLVVVMVLIPLSRRPCRAVHPPPSMALRLGGHRGGAILRPELARPPHPLSRTELLLAAGVELLVEQARHHHRRDAREQRQRVRPVGARVDDGSGSSEQGRQRDEGAHEVTSAGQGRDPLRDGGVGDQEDAPLGQSGWGSR